MKTVEQSILEMHKKGGNTRLTMELLKQLRAQEQKATDTVYEFFREHLKDDQGMKDFARHHYDGYLKNDPDYSSFEDWYKDSIYDMSGDSCKEGVEDWLGQLKHNGKLDQYLEDVKFQDFIKSKYNHCQLKFICSEGGLYPTVSIKVEFLEMPLAYGN